MQSSAAGHDFSDLFDVRVFTWHVQIMKPDATFREAAQPFR
jgi:hypothetical protein